MKQIANSSVYKLLGYLLLGIAAYALFNASNTDLQANSAVTQQQTPYKQNRHTITLVLSQLSDLKVEEGQRINVGEIISDRTSERTKLQAKKQRLEASLTRARLPLRELKPVPVPKFQSELAALKQAQFNLDVIVREIENFDKQLHFKDPFYSSVFESEKIQELADLKRRELEASINLEKATSFRCCLRHRPTR